MGMSSHLLCIDIGNTNVVLGLYAGNELVTHWRVATEHGRMPDEYAVLLMALFANRGFTTADIGGIAISSVVPPVTGVFEELCRDHFGQEPLVVGAGVKTGVRIRYDSPREVGADRVTNAVAVKSLYSVPACVVDFGTATTFDAIDAAGDYLGGAIAPGIGISAEALFSRTAKLPRVELIAPAHAIGGSTVESMQSGLLFGYVGLVEGMVARFRRELGLGMTVVGTGGLASVIARETPVFDALDPWLTLKGLRLIYDMNR
jgi:type III pantothenate kinase